jgi:hypothetical protein
VRASRDEPGTESWVQVLPNGEAVTTHMSDVPYERTLISYPVSFTDAPLGTLRLPKDLTDEEASRLKAMIDTLVIVRKQDAA